MVAADCPEEPPFRPAHHPCGERPDQQPGEWLRVRSAECSAAAVRRVDLLSLSRQEAKIQIRYVGSAEQLKSSLAEVDLGLGGTDPVWQLQISSATGSR
jgi:hypothetical protein